MEILFLKHLNDRQTTDLQTLIRLCEAACPSRLIFDLSDPEGSYFMAYEGNLLAAALAVYGAGEDLECTAAVLPEQRRKGFFRELLSSAEKHFPERELLFLIDGKSPSAMAVISNWGCPLLYQEELMEITAETFLARFPSPPVLPGRLTIISEEDDGSEACLTFKAYISSSDSKGSGPVLVGSCSCSVFDGSFCIWGVEVEPAFRRQGIGEALLISALSSMFRADIPPAADSGGYGSAFLHVDGSNLPAMALYKKTGFSVRQEIFYYGYRL